jgi:hypothetical protein
MVLQYRMLSQPATVIRDISVEIFDALDAINSNKLSSDDLRFVLSMSSPPLKASFDRFSCSRSEGNWQVHAPASDGQLCPFT